MTDVSKNATAGTPAWVDLSVPDLARAESFYGPLFGWEFLEGAAETGRYTMCTLRGKPVAAIMPHPEPNATEFWWNVYFATGDVDATAQRITDAGGQVVMPPMDVMDKGRMAMALDPQGAQFGLWLGRAHTGAEIVNEPGAFTWNELVTPDTKKAAEFYSGVLQVPVESTGTPDFDYLTINVDGRPVGGVFGAPDEKSAQWTTYFAVADTEAAVATVTGAGGKVVHEPADSPFGRFAVLTDPFGARFAVIRLNPDRPQ